MSQHAHDACVDADRVSRGRAPAGTEQFPPCSASTEAGVISHAELCRHSSRIDGF
jgi:hypothetical protein